MFQISAFTVFADEETMSSICIEAENYLKKTGGYTVVEDSNLSKGKGIVVDSSNYEGADGNNTLEYSFAVEKQGRYDIWVLSTDGLTNYVSQFKWKLDGGAYAAATKDKKLVSFRTPGITKTTMYWIKLSTAELKEGTHSFGIKVDEKRTMSPNMYLHAMDCIMLVPEKWKFEPNELDKPFNVDDISVEYVSGEIKTKNIKREGSVEVNIYNKITKKASGSPKTTVRLLYNGSKVTEETKSFTIPMNKWRPGARYEEDFSLNIPFDAPDGEYEIVTFINNIPYENGNEYETVGKIKLGDRKEETAAEMNVKELVLPKSQTKGTEIAGSAVISLNKVQETAAGAYIALHKGEELWGVIETEDIDLSGYVPNTDITVPIKYSFTEDVPNGDYILEFGIHKYKNGGKNEEEISVGGEDLNPDRTQKPMSNGKYTETATGGTHFWYVNQSLAMYWDGKPYIPVGGMFCPDYLVKYDINKPEENKKNFEHDKEILKTLLDNGINDVYINNGGLFSVPIYTWQFFSDYLEEIGMHYGWEMSNYFAGYVGDYEKHTSHMQKQEFLMTGKEGGVIFKATGITGNGKVSLTDKLSRVTSDNIETVLGCAYIVIDNKSGEKVSAGYGEGTRNGDSVTMSANISNLSDGDYSVVFLPKIQTIGGSNGNFWDDPYWNEELARRHTSQWKPGENFRFFVDPVRNEPTYFNEDEASRTVSPNFAKMYVEWLEDKYGTTDALNEAWQTVPKLKSFEQAAEIMPMYTNAKGSKFENILYAMDMRTNELFDINIRSGVMWDDYLSFKFTLMPDFHDNVSNTVKKNINAPVVIKHVGISAPFMVSKETTSKGIDGIGAESYGIRTSVRGKTLYAYSDAIQAKKTMWFPLTETNTEENMRLKYTRGDWGYADETEMHDNFDCIIEAGAKGIFDFLICHDGYIGLTYGYPVQPERYGWLKAYKDKLLGENGEKAEAFAKECIMPSLYLMYPASQNWWLSAPTFRNSVLYDDDYSKRGLVKVGGRLSTDTYDPTLDTETIIIELKDAPATKIYGPKLLEVMRNDKKNKNFVFCGLREDIGALSEIDKYYTNEKAALSKDETVQILKPTETSSVFLKTKDGRPYGLRDGNLYIIASSAWSSMDKANGNQYSESNYLANLKLPSKFDIKAKEYVAKEEEEDAKEELKDIGGSMAEMEIKYLYENGYVTGGADGNYNPQGNVTIAEASAVIIRAMKLEPISFDGAFADVSKDDWYADYVQTAYNMGLYDEGFEKNGKINPNSYITREQLAEMTAKAYCVVNSAQPASTETFDDVKNTQLEMYIGFCKEKELMNGDGNNMFRPKENVSRAETALVIYRYLKLK